MTFLLDDFMTRPLEATSAEVQLYETVAAHNATLVWSNPVRQIKIPTVFVHDSWSDFISIVFSFTLLIIIVSQQWLLFVLPCFVVSLFWVKQKYVAIRSKSSAYYGICKDHIWLSTKDGVQSYNFKQIWSFESKHYNNNTSDIHAQYARHLDKRDYWGYPAVAFTLKGIKNGPDVLQLLQQLHAQHPSYRK